MKKKIVVVCVSLLFAVALCFVFYFNFIDTLGLKYMGENESIVYFDSEWNTYSVVSSDGNCYITGERLTNDKNYGIDNVRKYNNHPINRYVRIYDRGDAAFISINQFGGAIITNTDDVYVFLNNSKIDKTPTLICSGYSNAVVGDNERIYLLSKTGEFGYVTADNPNEFLLIGTNVTSFNVVNKGSVDSVFALTGDHRLYILEPDENIDNNKKYINNIYDFDVLVPHSDLCVLSVIDNKKDAYILMRNNDVTYDNFSDIHQFQKTGENVYSVTSYDRGVAMMYDNGDVALYGSDFEIPDNLEFHGDVLFSNTKEVFGGYNSLVLIDSNEKTNYYGRTPDEKNIEITPK